MEIDRMKAIKFVSPGGLSNLKIVHIDDPGSPGPNEIRVRIHACSLNGHDYNVALGILPVEDGRILMTDGAGIVEAIGSDVTEFALGDLVVSTFFPDWQQSNAPLASFARTPGDGLDGYAVDTVVRPENWFTKAPRNWSSLESATLPTAGVTAWRGLVVEGKLKAGEAVLVLGTGGVSVFAIQLAKEMGARVIVTSSSNEKLERARTLGADFGVNYIDHPNWFEEVLKATDGRGVDLVIETGGPGTLPQSMKATRIGGHIVMVGVLTGISGQVPTAALMGRQQTLHGITVGSRAHQIEMIHALDKMNLRPVIDTVYPFEKIAEAFQFQEGRKHFGKICLEN
jgi:NADPH:quinone reductase-like Zn-dependent oxidoreductase